MTTKKKWLFTHTGLALSVPISFISCMTSDTHKHMYMHMYTTSEKQNIAYKDICAHNEWQSTIEARLR